MGAGEGAYMNVKIGMSSQPNQDGHCGNFNGNVADDDRVQVRSRVGKTGVPAGPDFLFPWGKTPINPGNRPDMNDCPPGTSKTPRRFAGRRRRPSSRLQHAWSTSASAVASCDYASEQLRGHFLYSSSSRPSVCVGPEVPYWAHGGLTFSKESHILGDRVFETKVLGCGES